MTLFSFICCGIVIALFITINPELDLYYYTRCFIINRQGVSDNIKPVYESVQEQQTTYRPSVVGGPIGHVVGVSPAIPHQLAVTEPTPQEFFNNQVVGVKPGRLPRPPVTESTQRIPSYVRFPPRRTETTVVYPTRRPRPRKLNNDTFFGSFFDLFFK